VNYDECLICSLPVVGGGCKHTPEERKKAEEDQAWSDHEWEDPSGERIRRENEEYDKKRGAYSRTFKEDR
jgi:hypothetical protein